MLVAQAIQARNVNDLFISGMQLLRSTGKEGTSRNGPVVYSPGPVTSVYMNPMERILWSPVRDANPVFHLVECLWMLAGRQDSGLLIPFSSKMGMYAEDDGDFWGAYGYRWQAQFGFEQLGALAEVLRKDPDTRRAVLQMWDSQTDLNYAEYGQNTIPRDLPCNTHIYFDRRGGPLNMTVCNRSNDAVWGAYGANAVHFSFLQQVLADHLGIPVGWYAQMSNNLHFYKEMPNAQALWETPLVNEPYDLYREGQVRVWRDLIKMGELGPFLEECESFCEDLSDYISECACPGRVVDEELLDAEDFNFDFIKVVAIPLVKAYLQRKRGAAHWRDYLVYAPHDLDWVVAFQQWAARREE